MAVVLHQPKESIAGNSGTGKKPARKSSGEDSYIIYSTYYNDQPEGGYVVYSNDQNGWEFFGYLPAKQPALITEAVHCRKDIQLL